MGLFGKKKEPEPQKPQEELNFHTEWEKVTVNLTDKMLRVELEGDTASAGHTSITESNDRIRIVSDGIIIAEVGKRGKAYKELEPYIGKGAERIEIEARTGEYGEYYRLKLLFKSTIVTI